MKGFFFNIHDKLKSLMLVDELCRSYVFNVFCTGWSKLEEQFAFLEIKTSYIQQSS